MTKNKEYNKLDFISDEYGIPKGLLHYQVNGHGMTVSQAIADWETYITVGSGFYRYNLLKGFINQITNNLQQELDDTCI